MTEQELLLLLIRVWHRDLSADEAFELLMGKVHDDILVIKDED